MKVLEDFLSSGFRKRFEWDCPAEHWESMMSAKAYDKKAISPESSALFFYQGQDWIYGNNIKYGRYEELPRAEANRLQAYMSGCDHLTSRLSVYILKICFREMRHGSFKDSFFEKWQCDLDEKRNEHLKKLSIKLTSSPSIKKAHGYTVAECCQTMEYMFRKGSWGSAYGGKKWAHIADTLHDFCKGKITPEMFCDRAFNLAHNTSPIFNKGGEFNAQNAHKLLEILNLQAEGQISKYKGDIQPIGHGQNGKGVEPIANLHPWTKEII